MKQANQRLLAKTAAEDPLFKEVLDSQQSYLAKARPWTMISDYAYLKSVAGD